MILIYTKEIIDLPVIIIWTHVTNQDQGKQCALVIQQQSLLLIESFSGNISIYAGTIRSHTQASTAGKLASGICGVSHPAALQCTPNSSSF